MGAEKENLGQLGFFIGMMYYCSEVGKGQLTCSCFMQGCWCPSKNKTRTVSKEDLMGYFKKCNIKEVRQASQV